MLLLNRKKGESLIIGDNIEIIVVEVQGDTVKLGISAPRSISVYRKEIYEEIVQANRQARENLSDMDQRIKALRDIVRKEK